MYEVTNLICMRRRDKNGCTFSRNILSTTNVDFSEEKSD